ncbi:MAG: NAD(P)H-dependent oxidoreductase subunit E, partial [Deltaproteobacteria bacterium]|nr:NAD(P)H-dependent oxidoreductase subunit E [Deltaproteobacteria bacterium]
GGQGNLNEVIEQLHISPGDTTADRRFSLETVRCLGACGLAPVMMVDEDTHRQVKSSKVQEIIKDYD